MPDAIRKQDGDSGFAYVDLADDGPIIEIQRRLQDAMPDDAEIDWQIPKTFHITLAFAPSVTDEQLRTAAEAVAAKPLEIQSAALGVFENGDERALHLTVELTDDLRDLQRRIYERLAGQGVALSPYSVPDAYTPHITLAYLPPGIDIPAIPVSLSTMGERIVYGRGEYKPYVTVTLTSQTEVKMVMRPSQAEVNYTPLSAVEGKACANCRWFTARQVDQNGTYAYCHLIENYPAEILPTGVCDRHEAPALPDAPGVIGLRETTPEAVIDDDAPFDDGFGDAPTPAPDAPLDAKALTELASIDGTAPVETPADDAPTDVPVAETADPPPALPPAGERALPREQTEAIRVGAGGLNLKAIRETIARWLGQETDALATGVKVHGNHLFIVWSNNFEDRDGELFTEKAIDDYVRRVDLGIVPPPAIWVWHADAKARIGQAAWVARHGHFVVAAAQFDDTPQGRAANAYYRRHARKTAVSHGFRYPSGGFDGRHYHRFNTFEISLLPRGKEANRFTSLEGIKAMALTEEKVNYLKDVFGEAADDILADLEKRGKALEAIGVEFKDFTAPEDAAAPADDRASAALDTAVKALLGDLVRDNAALVEHLVAQQKAFDAYKTDAEARDTERGQQLKALQEQLDSRPRSASRDEATELTSEQLKAIEEQAAKQTRVIDPFTGLEVDGGAA